VACSGIGITMSVIAPALIGGYTAAPEAGGLGLDQAHAGRYVTLELLATALAAMASAPLIARVRLSHILIASAGLVLVANLSALLVSPPGLWPFRILAGAGAGMAVGAGNAIIARSIDPDRLYGLSATLATAYSALALIATPGAVSHFGYTGIFGLLALNVGILCPIFLLLPDEANSAPRRATGGQPGVSVTRAAPLLISAFLLNVSDGAIYGFSQIIGGRSGLEPEAASAVLAAGGFLGIAGALLAALVGIRFGRLAPVTAAIVVQLLSGWVITTFRQPEAYVAMQLMLSLSFWFAITYTLGLGAAIDPGGSVSASLGGVILLGSSVGPWIGGAVIKDQGYAALGLTCAILSALALATFFVAERRLRRLRT
jgi:predicted MFS family arabinose efflux permease